MRGGSSLLISGGHPYLQVRLLVWGAEHILEGGVTHLYELRSLWWSALQECPAQVPQLWWPVTTYCWSAAQPAAPSTTSSMPAPLSSMQRQALRGSATLEQRVRRTTLHCEAVLSCRTLLAREQGRIRAEYEERVRQLEQERQGVEEERVQVESKHCSHHVGLRLYTV